MTGMEGLSTRWRQQRFNPLKSLTPTRLSNALDSQDAGWLREAALLYSAIEQRDAICRTVINKRRQAVSRRGWAIKVNNGEEDNPQAERHAEVLEYFYRNLIVTDATDLNVRTGMRGLVRQMMGAIMPRYAAHEIVWRPTPEGLTAEMRHVPIYFFENRTGRLRFVGASANTEGEELGDGEWMITVADSSVGEAISIVYMFRRLAIQDWLAFSEKFSIPGVIGRTRAKKGTPEGDAARDSFAAFGSEWQAVIYEDDGTIKDPVQVIQTAASSGMPQQEIASYMDKMITILCRGGDLGTLSQQDSQGASLQGGETAALLEDDAAMITETLQTQLDPLVIRHAIGETQCLAHIVIEPPADVDEQREVQLDTSLAQLGVKQDVAALAQRFGREHDAAAPAPPIAAGAAAPPLPGMGGGSDDGVRSSAKQTQPQPQPPEETDFNDLTLGLERIVRSGDVNLAAKLKQQVDDRLDKMLASSAANEKEADQLAATLTAARRMDLLPVVESLMSAAEREDLAEMQRIADKLTSEAPELEAAMADILTQSFIDGLNAG